MNKKRAKELLPIIEAFANGTAVQFKNSINKWEDIYLKDASFYSEQEYRIKPQPIEVWCMVNSDGECLGNFKDESSCMEQLKTLTNDNPSMAFSDYKTVKFMQVIDD